LGGFIWRCDAEQESGIIIEYMRMPLPVCGDGDHRGGGQFYFSLLKETKFLFSFIFRKGSRSSYSRQMVISATNNRGN
jgi:hypothetical protein